MRSWEALAQEPDRGGRGRASSLAARLADVAEMNRNARLSRLETLGCSPKADERDASAAALACSALFLHVLFKPIAQVELCAQKVRGLRAGAVVLPVETHHGGRHLAQLE